MGRSVRGPAGADSKALISTAPPSRVPQGLPEMLGRPGQVPAAFQSNLPSLPGHCMGLLGFTGGDGQ